jgi:hypothetical protein
VTATPVLLVAATNANDERVSLAALGKLSVRTVLVDVATAANTAERVRMAALAKLDPARFLENAEDESICLALVKRISDQAILAEVAKNHKDDSVRQAAVEKLTDQAVLVEVVKSDSSSVVREAAVKSLTDQDVLANVASNDRHESVGLAAVSKLTNQARLAEVARGATAKNIYAHWRVRILATRKLSDQDLLSDLAMNHEDASIRAAACGNLANTEVLIQIARNDTALSSHEDSRWHDGIEYTTKVTDYPVREAARQRLIALGVPSNLVPLSSESRVALRSREVFQ